MTEIDNNSSSDLDRLRVDVVQVQRHWYAALAEWEQDPSNRGRYEAYTAVGLRLHSHPYWAAVGGNRFEAQKKIRELAADEDGA
ncbi:hypothetical protein [Streptomyces sp. NRRL S-495]|uniref:hypothetical protein n=1 Tax=Streptomyces sp. NRRL S-495 TaxID=1609133 RepID=UPI0005F8E5D2|nr:hypothetical protein [Streptomyces sp. NRRL S-495]KJY26523.1 hypothetical protein VR45_36815 [Streptomyces sp. NRRL S-495]